MQSLELHPIASGLVANNTISSSAMQPFKMKMREF
jgi:hypothetical protein